MALMNRLFLAVGLSLLSSRPTLRAADVEQVTLDNAVSECFSIAPGRTFSQSNLLLLSTTVKRKQSIAECGCKAAALTYRVRDHRGRQVNAAEIWSLTRDRAPEFEFTFVLEPDRSIQYRFPLQMSVGCSEAP